MEDEFYATIKLKTGEEIFAKVSACEENDKTMLLIFNPITISQIKNRSGLIGYSVEPWLKTTTEDLFLINFDDILTISESSDIEIIMMHQSYVRQSKKETNNYSKITRKMGYIANVNDAKDILEKIFNNS